MILSVKNPFVDITILSDFLYNSSTISGRSSLIKGSPPVILVKRDNYFSLPFVYIIIPNNKIKDKGNKTNNIIFL